MNNSAYEIDFIPVDSGEKNGDAITMRVKEDGIFTIYVIDGGKKETGENIINHLDKYYSTNRIDYLINTHPDLDHISGLTVLAEKLDIGEIWMHKPWEYASELIDDIIDGRVTENSLTERLRNSLSQAKRIEEIAKERGIDIKEPFQGEQIGVFKVLSPQREWYIELIKSFNEMPQSDKKSFLGEAFRKFSDKITTVLENWNLETLSEEGVTSAKNESSAILYGELPNIKILLTGDAGLLALESAYDYAVKNIIDLKSCKFIQIPHHGGRRNVSPSILNKIVGPILPENSIPLKYAYVNVSKDCDTHPKKSVSNAFKRRGAEVHPTKGLIKCQYEGFPLRPGWVRAVPLDFFNQVEE